MNDEGVCYIICVHKRERGKKMGKQTIGMEEDFITYDNRFCGKIEKKRQNRHKEMEFVYVKQGTMTIVIEGNSFFIDEGKLLAICSGALHFVEDYSEDNIVYAVKVRQEELYMNISFQRKLEIDRSIYFIQTDEYMQHIIEQIMNHPFPNYNMQYIEIKAAELTLHIIHKPESIVTSFRPKVLIETETTDKMLNYIDASLHKEITLSNLAEYMGFSMSYCSRYIKKKTNYNFLDYVNSKRLYHAENLLRETELSITEIALTTGFKSIQSFNRTFRTKWGKSPSEYRKNK